jgi:lipid-binding SYLF domain-containing protein
MNSRIATIILVALAFAVAGCTTTGSSSGNSDTRRQSINANVDNALANLYQQEPGSRELVNRARAVLVFPSVLEAGFIVGAASGDGALRKGGSTASYHRMRGGSVGLQAGAQSTAVFLLFMTDDALRSFEASRGWTAGVDASVTMLTVGASAQMTTATAQQPVIGYVLSNSGLRVGVTVDGTRITRLRL